MRIVGKKAAVDEFIKVVESDYHYSDEGVYRGSYDRHLSRIFNREVTSYIAEASGQCAAEISGDCAWSVYSCMTEGGYFSRRFFEDYSDRSHATTLKLESGKLGLEIEVFSEESGLGFREHFLYDNGETIIDECFDI